MGGLDFFCTTMELPDGDTDLLLMSMDAMNADPDPDAEDRKGCSGHVGKMIYSAGVKQVRVHVRVRVRVRVKELGAERLRGPGCPRPRRRAQAGQKQVYLGAL